MKQKQEQSIGEIYSKIKIESEEISIGEKKLYKEPEHYFVRLCKKLSSFLPNSGKGAKFSEENARAIEFLQWNLTPEEFASASIVVMIISILTAILLGSAVLFTPLNEILKIFGAQDITAVTYAYFPFIIIAIAIVYFFQKFPAIAAKKEQTKALTYVPEMVGYMVMSIKLVPNLEKAVEFSSQHGKGKLAYDFKEVIWKTQLGIYNSISEGLDELAYRWGNYSSELKRALMRIRASVIENTEAKRHALLDETTSEMLDSIKNKMEQYARELSQPSTMLFYIGVLLPLLLIIILPVGSSFTGAPLANPIVLFLIYNILIPITAFAFAYSIIQQRPPTYEVPQIPDNYTLMPKWKANIIGLKVDIRIIALAVLLVGSTISLIVSSEGLPPNFVLGSQNMDACAEGKQLICPDLSKKVALERAGRSQTYFDVYENGGGELFTQKMREKLRSGELTEQEARQEAITEVKAEEQLFFSQSENDIAPYSLVFGLLITISIALSIILYYSSVYKRRAQLEIQQMESEFKDSLYVLASRMGENKPVEDAIKHVTEFLPDLKISKRVFAKIIDNIKLMGMPLEQAVFDQNYGAVAKIPSNIIRSSMKIMVDSVQLGSNVAARTLIALSIQLQNAEKVNNNLKVLVADVTGTMKTMAMFIAPMVLGLTTSLQRVVIVTIASIAGSGIASENATQNFTEIGSSFAGATAFIKPEAIATIASPTQFILIVALYIVEIVFIMSYFTTKIEEDNDVLLKMNLATFLPIAVIVFVVSMALSNMFVGSL
ncbi:MAG: hypothetical protein QXI10_02575 [Candidatus Diapherotrites archaeon]